MSTSEFTVGANPAIACKQAPRLGKTKRNWSRQEGKNGGACWHTIEVAIAPLWTNLSLICQWLIISSTWMHWNVNRSHMKKNCSGAKCAFLSLLWTKWNGGKKNWRAYATPTFVTYIRMLFFYVWSFGLFWGQYVLYLLASVLLANALLRLLFDFDTSVNCYMFCSSGLLGSFLSEKHVISLYNVLSGRTMFNITVKIVFFLHWEILTPGPAVF